MMKTKALMSRPMVAKCGGLALATMVSRWMSTLDYRTAYYDPAVDPALCHLGEQRYIYLFWHEYIPYQLYLRGNCNICMMLSLNRDANFLDRARYHLGFHSVRGSTYSRSLSALRGTLHQGVRSHLTMTPDGPRGPRRVMSAGAIYLASRLSMPLVLLGMGYDRPWRLSSWDQFAIPKPFSRARCVVSPPIWISTAPRPELERYRAQVEQLLTRLTIEAEQWAQSGKRVANEWPTRRSGRVLVSRATGAARSWTARYGAVQRKAA